MKNTIYREDAIKAEEDGMCTFYDCYVLDRINTVPPADRPQGVWIVDMLNYESICSVCGAKETEFIYGTEMWYGLGESRFCPTCGAKMKGARNK